MIIVNQLNLIVFNSEDYLSPRITVQRALEGLPLALHLVTPTTFPPQASDQEIHLFFLDDKSITNPAMSKFMHRYLATAGQQTKICLIAEAGIIARNNDLLANFQGFLMWPCSSTEIHACLVRFLLPKNLQFEQENKLLQEFSHLHLTGESPIFIKTISLIKRIAACHAPVLIQGETGTGKENAARAIHYLSNRRDHAFIPINCAAIPDELLESELFGHEKGTFTDAKTKQLGLVSLAQEGTLFLDEVDSLTPKAQAALLRFLQTQEYRPLGSKITLQANVRILAATNANLRHLVEKKSFRQDLYFRLNILNLEMPALRHRKQDIPLLASALIEKFSQQYHIGIKKIHPQTIIYLMQQPWIGNIRELENILLRHFLLSSDSTLMIASEHMPEYASSPQSPLCHSETVAIATRSQPPLNFQNAKARAINDFEEQYLKELMAMAEGNVSAAARISGKERRALGKLLQKHRIQKKSPYALQYSESYCI